MHPPLDRPHPDCQYEIKALRHCHETRPLWKIWACNDIKDALDECFRLEKEKMLVEINKDTPAIRKVEEETLANAKGRTMSFEEFLKTDPTYLSDLYKEKRRNPNQK
jgi:COX assembly mitochondrial protein 2